MIEVDLWTTNLLENIGSSFNRGPFTEAQMVFLVGLAGGFHPADSVRSDADFSQVRFRPKARPHGPHVKRFHH